MKLHYVNSLIVKFLKYILLWDVMSLWLVESIIFCLLFDIFIIWWLIMLCFRLQ
jgi:hypothetical protein